MAEDEKKIEIEAEHKQFLRNKANEIYELVRSPETMTRFREQVKIFCKKNIEHQQELKRIKKAYDTNTKLQKAWEEVQNDSSNDDFVEAIQSGAYVKNDGSLKGYKGYVYHHEGFWGPKTKTPYLWPLLIVPTLRYSAPCYEIYMNFELFSKASREEKLICKYALLAAIHDFLIREESLCSNQVFEGSTDNPKGCWNYPWEPNKWVENLWGELIRCTSHGPKDPYELGKETRAWIQRAVSDVKANLAKQNEDKCLSPVNNFPVFLVTVSRELERIAFSLQHEYLSSDYKKMDIIGRQAWSEKIKDSIKNEDNKGPIEALQRSCSVPIELDEVKEFEYYKAETITARNFFESLKDDLETLLVFIHEKHKIVPKREVVSHTLITDTMGILQQLFDKLEKALHSFEMWIQPQDSYKPSISNYQLAFDNLQSFVDYAKENNFVFKLENSAVKLRNYIPLKTETGQENEPKKNRKAMGFGLDNLKFWELRKRVSYRLGEWDNPAFAGRDRDDYRDSYITELERAQKVFRSHPEFFDKLPDDRRDPIIGLRTIEGLCHQIINDDDEKTEQSKVERMGKEKYQDFLCRIARQVDSLLIKDSSAMGKFRQHLQSCADKENKHIEWINEKRKQCLKKGMVFTISSNMKVPDEAKSSLSMFVIDSTTKHLPEPKNKEEEYQRYYIILASIHDKMLGETEKIDNGILSEMTSFFMRNLLNEFYDSTQRRAFIEQAFERVKAEKPAETGPDMKPDQSGEAINPSIKKEKPNWVFNFNSETATINHKLGGLALIEHLLTNKNKEFYPLELLKAVGQREEDEKPAEPIYTAIERKRIKAAIQNLKEELKETSDMLRREDLGEQIRSAEKVYRKSINLKGKSRKISERHRLSVIRKIDLVLGKISPQSPCIHNHLNSFLTRGELCHYKPDSEIVWDIS